MKNDPEGELGLAEREMYVSETRDGTLRGVARDAALLAERFGLLVLVYLEQNGGTVGGWMFSCESRGGGRFWWRGPSDVVAVCEDRHGDWREEFPLEGEGHG